MSTTFLLQDARTKKFYAGSGQWTRVPHIAEHVSNRLEAGQRAREIRIRHVNPIEIVEMNMIYVPSDHHVVCLSQSQMDLMRRVLENVGPDPHHGTGIQKILADSGQNFEQLREHLRRNDHSSDRLSGTDGMFVASSCGKKSL